MVFVTALMLFIGLVDKKNKGMKTFVWLSFIAIGVLIAFRSTEVGADTKNYYSAFREMAQPHYNSENTEIGYLWLVKILNKITSNAQILFILQGALVTVSAAVFVSKNVSKLYEAYIAVLSFMAFNLFSFHLSGVRQSFAMSICLFSYEFIKKKKLIWFLLLVGLATLFHGTAIFFIPAYFIANAKDKTAKWMSVLVTVLGIFFLEDFMEFFSLLNDRFAKYGIEKTDNGYIFFTVITIITVFELLFRESIMKKTALSEKQTKLNYVAEGMWCMRLFTRVIERISLFYMPSTVIVTAHTYGAMKTNRDKLIFLMVMTALLSALYLYRTNGLVYSFC